MDLDGWVICGLRCEEVDCTMGRWTGGVKAGADVRDIDWPESGCEQAWMGREAGGGCSDTNRRRREEHMHEWWRTHWLPGVSAQRYNITNNSEHLSPAIPSLRSRTLAQRPSGQDAASTYTSRTLLWLRPAAVARYGQITLVLP